jgi:cytochrome c oxidase assembly protein subunit 15
MTGVNTVLGWLRHPLALRRAALASVITNVIIIVTGGAVRLTQSGLGCPTWPKCTDDSLVTTPEMGIHGLIENGNRLLTGAVAVPAVLGVIIALAAVARRRDHVRLAWGVLGMVASQAVLGGITVRTGLNPWTVGAHFMLSIITVTVACALWVRAAEPDAPAQSLVPKPMRQLTAILVATGLAVLVVGTVVTGSGPHSGDPLAARNGLDPGATAQLHADLVFLLIGLTIAAWLGLKACRAPAPVIRAARILLIIELGQGLIGFVQYVTHLPVVLVGAHLAGAVAVWLGTLALIFSMRTRREMIAGTASELVGAVPGRAARR